MVRGTWGGACEFGHISVDFQGPACNCGSRGCLELYASGTGIARMMRQRLGIDATDDSRWIDAPSVFEAARAGDASARAVIADMIGALSTACISLIHTFNPQMIVLGGGVMEQGPWLFESLRKRIGQQGMPSLVGATEVVCAKFGADAGLIGAALQPFVYQCGWMRSEGHDD
nr:ROK family protein [Alicyclobacillus fastidiosus]